jgi:hypothetical protein
LGALALPRGSTTTDGVDEDDEHEDSAPDIALLRLSRFISMDSDARLSDGDALAK